MNVGFIGTGNMGSVLVQAFIRSNALKPDQLIIHNRTARKAEWLAEQYPGIRIGLTAADTAIESDLLFICVKPLEYRNVLDAIAASVRVEQVIVSITSPVLIRHLEEKLPSKIAKVVPSIANYEMTGATLCMYSNRMSDKDKDLLETLLCHISAPVRIDERHTRITSDISSIGPALMAFFVQQLIDSAVERTGIPRSQAARLAGEMVLGTGHLLTSGGFTPQSLQDRVRVPGGITAKALELLHDRADGLFREVIQVTHDKYDEDLSKVEAMMQE